MCEHAPVTLVALVVGMVPAKLHDLLLLPCLVLLFFRLPLLLHEFLLLQRFEFILQCIEFIFLLLQVYSSPLKLIPRVEILIQ